MKVHEKIRKLRLEKGWSQDDVAAKLGLSANGYGLIERGKTKPDLLRLEELAEVFSVNLIELCGDNESQVVNNSQNTQHHCNVGFITTENSELLIELAIQKALNEQKDKEILYLRSLLETFLTKENS